MFLVKTSGYNKKFNSVAGGQCMRIRLSRSLKVIAGATRCNFCLFLSKLSILSFLPSAGSHDDTFLPFKPV